MKSSLVSQINWDAFRGKIQWHKWQYAYNVMVGISNINILNDDNKGELKRKFLFSATLC
jgi:hypothetical protein